MMHENRKLRNAARWILLAAVASWLTSCTTKQVAPSTHAETLPEAITIPYRISAAGLYIVDIGVNGHAPQSFIVDTGANVSTIYDNDIHALGLVPNGQTVLVKGMVAIEARPMIEDVEFQIGTQTFQLDRVVVLEKPVLDNQAIGLLGTDLLSPYTVVFNKHAMTATFVPSKYIKSRTFAGWRRIPLRDRIGAYPDNGLHFAQISLTGRNVPALIDTGSNLNIVNWSLATLDDDMRRLQRTLRDGEKLYGALDSLPLRIETLFHDLVLGRHYWSAITVIVMDFDSLSALAPVDQPMMIAGASMFTPWTVAFDLGGDNLYIRANPGDPRPAARSITIIQSMFVPVSTEQVMN